MFSQFRIDPLAGTDPLFRSLADAGRPGYLAFDARIETKAAIKVRLESHPSLQQTLAEHGHTLSDWWAEARDDFAQLEFARNGGAKKLPEIRAELLASLKGRLVPLGVLDEFQAAGVFVNWWQAIRYDLKTIVSSGWFQGLIPDADLIAAYFQPEADAIEALEARIGEDQSALYVQDQIALHTLGQAVKGINIGEVKKLKIKIPSAREQKLIAQQLDELHGAYNSTFRQLTKLRRQKTALMQDLLTGKVRVTPLLEAQHTAD